MNEYIDEIIYNVSIKNDDVIGTKLLFFLWWFHFLCKRDIKTQFLPSVMSRRALLITSWVNIFSESLYWGCNVFFWLAVNRTKQRLLPWRRGWKINLNIMGVMWNRASRMLPVVDLVVECHKPSRSSFMQQNLHFISTAQRASGQLRERRQSWDPLRQMLF